MDEPGKELLQLLVLLVAFQPPGFLHVDGDLLREDRLV